MQRETRQLEIIDEDDMKSASEAPVPASVTQQSALGTCMASTSFPYSALPDHCIRLVTILPESTADDLHCALEVCPDFFAEDAHYTALSYCWGDPFVTKPITLDGRHVAVTTNLFHALVAIKQDHASLGPRRYWIDALCINQGNGEERNHQVHQMWRIFSSADEVFSWLGPADEHTDQAFEAIRTFGQSCKGIDAYCVGWKKDHDLPTESEMHSLRQLLDREYFGRTWVRSRVYLSLRETQQTHASG